MRKFCVIILTGVRGLQTTASFQTFFVNCLVSIISRNFVSIVFAFDEGERILMSPMPCSVDRFPSGWLTD